VVGDLASGLYERDGEVRLDDTISSRLRQQFF
jgi:hypothetical protein